MLVKKVEELLEKIKKEDKKINSFISLNPNVVAEARVLEKKKKKGRLYGKVIGIKSNINVEGLPITCASKTLENYKGSYDATVIEKIKEEDGLIIGMLNMDEFAAGSSGESSYFGPTMNPVCEGKIAGGSSSGSAAAIAAGFCDLTLGSDTGGSIRNPASHCGVVGMKPSYGLVSRYGLIDLSMSLDQIGPLGNSVEDVALLLDVILGKDEKDTMTFDSKKVVMKKPGSGVRVGVLKVSGVDPKIQGLIDERISEIKKKLGWKVKEIEIKHADLGIQTYYPLVYAEFFSGTRRFDGLRYGMKIEQAAGDEVLRRIFGGSEITKAEFEGAYYEKAKQVKQLIAQEFAKVFAKVDCVMLPTVPMLPWDIGKGKEMSLEEVYAADALTVLANLAGVCALSMPAGEISGMPVGLQIMCGKAMDSKLLGIAREVEKVK
jgi:aspartyl-tRNA(Asn)/glutamyl-tRNA(Gln) amidotransferase subunit A